VSERPPLLRVTGRLDAVALVLDLPADRVAALLPPGLELLPQNVLPDTRHPLILLFGQQSGVGPGSGSWGLSYLELALALPFVCPRGGPDRPYCHLPILLLDRRLPTLLGRWLYGFAKRRAVCQRSAEGFAIARLKDGAALLSARYAPTGPRAQAGKLGEFARVRCLFEQPLINRGRGGRWRYARFDFALAQAAVQPIAAEVAFHRALLPGMPLGPAPVRLPGPGGPAAFRLETVWTLTRCGPGAERQTP
jgi:hypothetical protein